MHQPGVRVQKQSLFHERWHRSGRGLQKHLRDQTPLIFFEYAKDCLPTGILGLNGDLFREYVQHIADRRLERIGLPAQYGSANPFPWMSETMDLSKEKNFFETRVTEYQSSGSLNWD